MKYLYEEGAVSESQYDAVRTDYEVSRASFESARRLVEIQSPIDGTVTAVNVRRGDYLSQGQQVATVALTNRLRVKFDVKSSDIHLIDVGDTVNVTREGVAKGKRGVVSSVAESADPFTRSFEVEALIDNTDGSFRPGMFVQVELIVERLRDVLAVPRDAVIELENGTAVFVVEQGRAFRRPVTLGLELRGQVVIESGVQRGDSVVTLGQTYLDDSLQVRITDVEKGA
jgi:RND family efflux transporter MFP subunit